jgi:hypothetical protein
VPIHQALQIHQSINFPLSTQKPQQNRQHKVTVMPEKLIIDEEFWSLIEAYIPLMSKEDRERLKQRQSFEQHQARQKARELRNSVLPSSLAVNFDN